MTKNTDNQTTVVCPHCGYRYDDYESRCCLNKDEIYSSFNLDCKSCGEEFNVEPDILFFYSTAAVENDDNKLAKVGEK